MTSTRHDGTGTGRPASDSGAASHQGSENPDPPDVSESDLEGMSQPELARLAEAADLKVIMNRCPKIELFRPFWKPRLDLPI